MILKKKKHPQYETQISGVRWKTMPYLGHGLRWCTMVYPYDWDDTGTASMGKTGNKTRKTMVASHELFPIGSSNCEFPLGFVFVQKPGITPITPMSFRTKERPWKRRRSSRKLRRVLGWVLKRGCHDIWWNVSWYMSIYIWWLTYTILYTY